jgi:hypothetical protein
MDRLQTLLSYSNLCRYAKGPFAAIWSIYEKGFSDKAEVPVWILVVGRCRLKHVFASTKLDVVGVNDPLSMCDAP